MALPVLRNWVEGELVTANMMNSYVRNVAQFFTTPPLCFMTRSSAQSIPNNTWTQVLWNRTVAGDSVDDMHTSGDAGAITCRTPGIYDVRAQVAFVANATGGRGISLDITGNPSFARSGHASAYCDPPQYNTPITNPYDPIVSLPETTVLQCGRFLPMTAGQQIRMYVYQNSGSSLNVFGHASHVYTWLCVRWVGTGD